MLLCLHEEHAVAIAHGYAKVTGRPMGAIVHSNVGPGTCHHGRLQRLPYDRVPMLIIGGAGPVDAARRRPWIDWIHTAADQGALIRAYSKWDDQPASVEPGAGLPRSAPTTSHPPGRPPPRSRLPGREPAESTLALTEKPAVPDVSQGPVAALTTAPMPPRSSATPGPAPTTPAARCSTCSGKLSRDEWDWDRRVALAERYGAPVISDLKNGAVFPTGLPAASRVARHLPARRAPPN